MWKKFTPKKITCVTRITVKHEFYCWPVGGTDAGTDAGNDAGGNDAGNDTGGTDASTDAGGTDAGNDAGGTDAGGVITTKYDNVIVVIVYPLNIRSVVIKPDRQWQSSSFQESKKVRVSRDLWPWPWPWEHPGCRLTCWKSCASLVAIRPIVCEKKRFAQKFTDRRTDDGRRAIALPHSWNELKMSISNTVCLFYYDHFVTKISFFQATSLQYRLFKLKLLIVGIIFICFFSHTNGSIVTYISYC